MKRRLIIGAALAALAFGALSGAVLARDCGSRCAEPAQYRDRDRERGQDGDSDRRLRPPLMREWEFRRPYRDTYGGPGGERYRTTPPMGQPGHEPLSDGQIWAIAKSRVPGRIINARLQGPIYSFRIISNRGSIVDVDVDRYSGRIVSVRGGP